MIYPIHLYGHLVLRTKTKEITPDFVGLKELIDNMYQTLEKAGGVGLAAPQIGQSLRLFIIDLDPLSEEYPEYKGLKKIYINPEITPIGEETDISEEGCLSIPEVNEKVERPSHIRITYLDEEFKEHSEDINGWMARVLQHEYDHIDAHLFIDHISPLRRRMIKGKLTAIQKRKVSVRYKIK
jgi:peptide deformylase